MIIKRWKKFNESQLDLFKYTSFETPTLKYKGLYPITEDEILDYLYEFEDNNYIVNIEFGSLDEHGLHMDYIEGNKLTPSIGIYIRPTSKTINIDITHQIKSFKNRVSTKFKKVDFFDEHDYNMSLRGKHSRLNIDDILIKGGIFLKSSDLEIEYPLIIQLSWFKTITITDKVFFGYYDINNPNIKFNDDGDAYLTFSAEDLCYVLNEKEYKTIIEDGGVDSDYYDIDGPSHYDMFRYYLNKETIKELLSKYDLSELSDVTEQNFENIDDIMSYLDTRYPKYNEIGRYMIDENSYYSDIMDMYDNMYESERMSDDYNQIFKSFKKAIEETLGTEMSYNNEKSNGVIYYDIKFNMKWYNGTTPDDIRITDIFDLVNDYAYWNGIREIKPNFSDYVTIDRDLFNQECMAILKT